MVKGALTACSSCAGACGNKPKFELITFYGWAVPYPFGDPFRFAAAFKFMCYSHLLEVAAVCPHVVIDPGGNNIWRLNSKRPPTYTTDP